MKICDNSELKIEMTSEEILDKPSKIGGADKDKKIKKGPRPTPPPGLKDDLTTISHICIILFVAVILYASFSQPFDFFTWHPLLLSVGWMFVMTEGVLFISKENPVGRRLNLDRTLKLRYHWIAIVISMILIALGFIVAVKTKNDRGKEHFKSLHAIFGLIAVLGCVPSAINGTVCLFDVELKRYIKPSLSTAIHVASGSIVVTFGGLALIMSVYTNWFKKHTDNNKYLLMLGMVTTIYVTIWTAQRPWRKTLRKFFHIDI